jgi:hypothetical protein
LKGRLRMEMTPMDLGSHCRIETELFTARKKFRIFGSLEKPRMKT